jgi:hypothetical protein
LEQSHKTIIRSSIYQRSDVNILSSENTLRWGTDMILLALADVRVVSRAIENI